MSEVTFSYICRHNFNNKDENPCPNCIWSDCLEKNIKSLKRHIFYVHHILQEISDCYDDLNKQNKDVNFNTLLNKKVDLDIYELFMVIDFIERLRKKLK